MGEKSTTGGEMKCIVGYALPMPSTRWQSTQATQADCLFCPDKNCDMKETSINTE